MKKQVIAVMMSIAVAMGSLGGVSVLAAETTTEESVPVQEALEENKGELSLENEEANVGLTTEEAVEEVSSSEEEDRTVNQMTEEDAVVQEASEENEDVDIEINSQDTHEEDTVQGEEEKTSQDQESGQTVEEETVQETEVAAEDTEEIDYQEEAVSNKNETKEEIEEKVEIEEKSNSMQSISADEAYFIDRKLVSNSNTIVFVEQDGHLQATWTGSRYYSWAFYIRWNNDKTEFRQIFDSSGVGNLLSSVEKYGSTMIGKVIDNGKWDIRIYNAQNNLIISDVFSLQTNDGIDLTADSDGDGLLDFWEVNGIDTDGDGLIDLDLPSMGAEKNTPDIFIEVDWMEGKKPKESSLRIVYNQFKRHGINLHIDVGPDSIDFVTGKSWGKMSGGNSITYSRIFELGDKNSNWATTANTNFSRDRWNLFRHCLFVNRYDAGKGTSSSGIAFTPGQFFIVADVDGWISGTDTAQAGTFMHELGHTLGLQHGGNDEDNLKPNYLSVMNYMFQTTGLVGNNEVDYSEYVLPSLDENNLNEFTGIDPYRRTAGTGLGTKWYFNSTNPDAFFLARLIWSFLADTQTEREAHGIAGNYIDFNVDGAFESSVKEDINNDGKYTTLAQSIKDWDFLSIDGGFVGKGISFGDEELKSRFDIDVDDQEELTEELAEELNLISNVPDDNYISNCDISLSQTSYYYDGHEKKPAVTIVKDGRELVENKDYKLIYKNNTDVGTATVSINGLGAILGTINKDFVIEKAIQTITAKPATFRLGVDLSTYISVSGIGYIRYFSSDPSVVTVDDHGWLEGIGEGTATITVTVSGNEYYQSAETSFEIMVEDVYEVTSGPCGDNATWTYFNNGTIEINGTGTVELIQNSSGDYLWDRFYTSDAVWHYDKVNTVIINEGITEIGREVFSERSSLGYGKMSDSPVTVRIADSVKTLRTRAFINCSKLEKVAIGAGLMTIGECAFSYCPSLKEISVSEDNESFVVVDGALYSKDLKNMYKLPNDGRTSFTIPKGTETIEMDAMGDLASLEKLTIPKSVKKIVEYALDGTDELTDVYYEGSSSQWKMLVIGDHNDVLEKASIHYAETEKTVEDCTTTLSEAYYIYDGKEKKPEVIVTEGNTVLKEGCDYQLIYKDNINAGTATVIITGMGSYVGKAEKTFEISPKKVIPTVVLSPASFIYNGKVQKPTVTVKDGNKELTTSDYTVTWPSGCTDVGTYRVSVALKGNYSGSGAVDYNITEKKITLGKTTRGDMFNLANNVKVTWKEVPGAKYYKVYREGITDPGESQEEPVIVTERLIGWDKEAGLTNGHAYLYRIVASLSGKGDSSGDSPLSYSKVMYRLKTVVIRSVKNTAPGKVTVKYDKTTSGDSYVLQYCEREDMVGAKTKVVLGADSTSYTIGGLKKGKTYYISIRVRKKVDGIDYYTTFGVPKKVKVEK